MIFLKSELTIFELFKGVSTIIIAASSLFFSFIIYKYQLKKDENDLRLNWYKTIIIEKRFEEFFLFFEHLSELKKKLTNLETITLKDREAMNNQILSDLSKLESNFISLLLSVDKMLYECVKKQFDLLVDGITEILGDDDLDWTKVENISEKLQSHISLQKGTILKLFVEFRGNGDSYKNKFDQLLLLYKKL